MANKEVKIKKTTKPKVDYKKKYDNSLKHIRQLEKNIADQKIENAVNIKAFQDKAKTFQDKAKKEVQKIRKEIHKKYLRDENHFKKYAPQKTIESIIDPILNIEIAVNSKSDSPDVQNYVTGFKMLIKQLDQNLEEVGVTKIVPKINEEYNPDIHHAFSTISGSNNKILEVKKNGIKFLDRTIRPAIVVIGKKTTNKK